MRLARNHGAHINPLNGGLVLGLITVMLVMALGDLLMAHDDWDCEGQCDDSCQDCDSCLNCLPTVHMIPVSYGDLCPIDRVYLWTTPLISTDNEEILSVDIDHPPQNLL